MDFNLSSEIHEPYMKPNYILKYMLLKQSLTYIEKKLVNNISKRISCLSFNKNILSRQKNLYCLVLSKLRNRR